ncbi:hypothetical protein [Anaeromyxobacter sp. SG66]|uniref:hypothetical protein n=1 Tax=Anaeromyxobacter sp. SG66 TaxID=2925410 RepID=UPI001F57592F|nr:hypothetical protein [Anaeromyxobacter sp. SG66]
MKKVSPEPGVALFVGWQDASNDVINQPPRPYLTDVASVVVRRSWFRAALSLHTWRGRDLYMMSFVDPETKIVFDQPDRDHDEEQRAAWFRQRSEEWTFSDARALARWLQLYAQHIDDKTPRSRLGPKLPAIWREYVEGRRADAAPLALGLPLHPDEAYATSGWAGWEDWHWKTREDTAESRVAEPRPRSA